MSELIVQHQRPIASVLAPLPVPNAAISVRVGTREDIPFIDALQKKYGKELGFFPHAQLEGYIDNGWVLIAEMNDVAVAYVASRDRYLKRDELGVIYQLCVSPTAQRGLIGASLIKAMFERSAYGCRLYCCWCAQDLAANRFWESLGFVPIAFRGGSSGKNRVHIFWQKRIRSADASTPWWYPSETGGGAIRENRLVLPIPPGVRWDDQMPVLMPTEQQEPRIKTLKAAALPKTKAESEREPTRPKSLALSRPSFGAATPVEAAIVVAEASHASEQPVPREKRAVRRNDPELVRRARELRDRWLERINSDGADIAIAKYDVSRTTEFHQPKPVTIVTQGPMLALPSIIAA